MLPDKKDHGGRKMKRRTLDILFSVGGIGLAAMALILALVLTSNANFSRRYVKDQLSQQKIAFKTLDKLTPEEKAFTAEHTNGLIRYAGQPLTTGKQAEVYANEFIALHLQGIADGQTYAELGGVQNDIKAKIATAEGSNDPTLPDLQKQLADVTAVRETVFKGEMLRGALLSTFGFSVLGDKAQQGATVGYIVAGLLVLLSIAGFVHAFVIPKNKPFAPIDQLKVEREPVGV
jgi:hypothetical protein